jgi:hypothetical protein
MNRYERFVSRMGFTNPRQGKTKADASDIVGLKFDDCDPSVVRSILGKSNAHKPDMFFYKIAKSKAILVDTARNRILLANSKKAVAAFLKTVNN